MREAVAFIIVSRTKPPRRVRHAV